MREENMSDTKRPATPTIDQNLRPSTAGENDQARPFVKPETPTIDQSLRTDQKRNDDEGSKSSSLKTFFKRFVFTLAALAAVLAAAYLYLSKTQSGRDWVAARITSSFPLSFRLLVTVDR